jgi:hypothetical protein
MNREVHTVRQFDAVDDDGNEYTIIEYQEMMEQRFREKPSQWTRTGPSWLRLDDGTPVNQIDADTFKIATDDRIIKRVR